MKWLWLLLLASCTPVSQCKVYYRWDGRDVAPGVKPYYKVVECEGQKPQFACEDDKPLPTDKCK